MVALKKKKLQIISRFAKRSALEALLAIVLYSVVYYAGTKLEIVRSNAVDPAFSYSNLLYFSGIKSNDKNSTKVHVYQVNQAYLKKEGLLDDYNETNYGYTFPREKIAAFIENIDNLPQEKQPLALFIDYEMSFGTTPGGELSKGDKIFLDRLSQTRNYKILLPKTQRTNIVETYIAMLPKEEKIKQQNLKENILFANVDFLESDGIVRRYNPMKVFPDNNMTYYNVSLVLWQLVKNGKIITAEIEKQYNPQIFTKGDKVTEGASIVISNILLKNKISKHLYDEHNISYDEFSSRWQGLYYHSALPFFVSDGFDNRSIVMFGGDFGDQDMKNLASGERESGVGVHAQALKTVLYLDGSLEKISYYFGFIIVFFVYFMIAIVMHYLFHKFNLSSGFRFLLGLLILLIIFFSISSYFLIEYKQWFNWFIPVIIFYVDDAIIFVKGGVGYIKAYRKEKLKKRGVL